MKLAILIPIYNEEKLLRDAVARLDAVPPPTDPASNERLVRRLILVDDGSTDGTGAILDELAPRTDVLIVRHPSNKGKGAALKSALHAALADGADILLIHDADLEYDPADHASVLEPILNGRADAVIGTRFLGRSHRVLYFWHYAANRLITLFSNMLTNLNLSDIECCTKAFTRRVAQQLTITEPRFGVEPELIAKLASIRISTSDHSSESPRPARIYEVAVTYAGRTYAEGKKITWRDGISALRCIIVYNLLR
ncbi:MAG: glycosyltransferase family 2 protein [Phycisphaeraceae bacterium]|nr:MAG: glycosyltransferase family 2 protein [Phycisphaeraceae bacterium]